MSVTIQRLAFSGAMVFLAVLCGLGTAAAQALRYPPNAHAANCLWDPTGDRSSPPELYGTASIERLDSRRVRVQFTLTNYCATRVSVSGLEPSTSLGALVVEDAPIEVGAISEIIDDGTVSYVLSGTASLGVFDVPALATVTHGVEVALSVGSASDVVAATAVTHGYSGGLFALQLGDSYVQAAGVGIRSVCVHYADRPCGAYQ